MVGIAATAAEVTAAAIAAAIAVAADARPRVTAVADVLLPAVAIRRRAADRRTVAADRRTAVDRRTVAADPRTAAADRRTAVAVAADMEGNTALESFPA
jgi:hypothetical protein